jgi:hypothetical protein
MSRLWTTAVFRREGFGACVVDGRGPEMAALVRVVEGRFVDQRAARDVDEDRTRRHGRERGRVEEVLVVVGAGRGEHDDVAAREHLVQLIGTEQLVDERIGCTRFPAASDADEVQADRSPARTPRPIAETHDSHRLALAARHTSPSCCVRWRRGVEA